MGSPVLERLTELVGDLPTLRDADRREHALLAAACESGAEAAAIWRQRAGPGGPRWEPERARGPADALPAPTVVRGVLTGGPSWGGFHLLRAGEGQGALALVLGGTWAAAQAGTGSDADDVLDALEAALMVLWLVDVEAGSTLREGPPGPLPNRPLTDAD